MQDNLKNPYKSLQLIAQKELTGCLSISIPEDNSISWQLYIGGSRLYFATVNGYHPKRFGLLWQQIMPERTMPKISSDKSEYENLYEWQVENQISLTEFRKILLHFSREALIQAISHTNAYVKFESNTCIKPVLIAAPLTDIIKPVANHVRFWQKMHTHVASPCSRIHLDSSKIGDFSNFWKSSNNASIGKVPVQNIDLSVWLEILEQKVSIYEICQRLKIEPHLLLSFLHPLIENKTLEILPSAINLESETNLELNQPSNKPLIACIDDSHTVQRQVKMVLESSGFQVLGITDPTSCLTSLIRQKPALILMDITMPKIDGYELCNMLRQSRHMRNVPIIMFTGREGIIDRVRAQLVGANDYITKPVNTNKLISKVQQLIQTSQKSTNQQEQESLRAL
ncbi:MAG: response regulator [Pseudanabaena sp. CAN_BIN31]|nr:response regulator [Pseudanabaena sp. CAN_BIN31]